MEKKNIVIELFTIPQAACDSGKANWEQVAKMVKKQLEIKFGDVIHFKHIEFMSKQWFENIKAQEILEKSGINFPFVFIDGVIACADKKINISKITRIIQSKLQQ